MMWIICKHIVNKFFLNQQRDRKVTSHWIFTWIRGQSFFEILVISYFFDFPLTFFYSACTFPTSVNFNLIFCFTVDGFWNSFLELCFINRWEKCAIFTGWWLCVFSQLLFLVRTARNNFNGGIHFDSSCL